MIVSGERASREYRRLCMPLGLGLKQHALSAYPTPLQIFGANLLFWVYAGAGITIATGVSGWADQSTTGDANKNLAQATAGKQPTFNASAAAYNNQPTLGLASASSQDLVSGAWATLLALPETLYVVGNADGTSANQYYSDGGAVNQRAMSNASGHTSVFDLIYNGAELQGGPGTGSSTTPQIIVGYFDTGANSSIWVSTLTPFTPAMRGRRRPIAPRSRREPPATARRTSTASSLRCSS